VGGILFLGSINNASRIIEHTIELVRTMIHSLNRSFCRSPTQYPGLGGINGAMAYNAATFDKKISRPVILLERFVFQTICGPSRRSLLPPGNVFGSQSNSAGNRHNSVGFKYLCKFVEIGNLSQQNKMAIALVVANSLQCVQPPVSKLQLLSKFPCNCREFSTLRLRFHVQRLRISYAKFTVGTQDDFNQFLRVINMAR
jgi:hypothetical protein